MSVNLSDCLDEKADLHIGAFFKGPEFALRQNCRWLNGTLCDIESQGLTTQ
jgi:hypothetical protein